MLSCICGVRFRGDSAKLVFVCIPSFGFPKNGGQRGFDYHLNRPPFILPDEAILLPKRGVGLLYLPKRGVFRVKLCFRFFFVDD